MGNRVRDFLRQLPKCLAPNSDLTYIFFRPIFRPNIVNRKNESIGVTQDQRVPVRGQIVPHEHVRPRLGAFAHLYRIRMRCEKKHIGMGCQQACCVIRVKLRHMNQRKWVLRIKAQE